MRTFLVVVACLLTPSLGAVQGLRTEPTGGATWMGLSKPSRHVKVGAEQTGRIVEMLVREGDLVERGDVMFRLDTDVEEWRVKRLGMLAESDVEVRRAEAELEQAKLEEQRVRDLLTERIRSETDLIEAEHRTRLARILLEKAAVDQARVRLEWDEARARLAQRTVRSPIDGTVVKLHHQKGDTIDELEPVIEVVDLDPLWVEFHCSVEEAELFESGKKFLVRRAARPEEVREAVVRHASMVADPSSQTFLTRLEVANGMRPWRAGVKVIIEIPTAAPGGAGRKGR